MLDNIRELFDQLMHSRWEDLGEQTAFLDIYDSLLAGVASWYIEKKIEYAPRIPGPDAQWCILATTLSQKITLTGKEETFFGYFQAAEKLRIALKRERDKRAKDIASDPSLSDLEIDILVDAASDYHGIWRTVWDAQALFPEYTFPYAKARTNEALMEFFSKGWLALYGSTLLPDHSRTQLELFAPTETESILRNEAVWLPPKVGDTEILYWATAACRRMLSGTNSTTRQHDKGAL